jgi:hypothetical protein
MLNIIRLSVAVHSVSVSFCSMATVGDQEIDACSNRKLYPFLFLSLPSLKIYFLYKKKK